MRVISLLTLLLTSLSILSVGAVPTRTSHKEIIKRAYNHNHDDEGRGGHGQELYTPHNAATSRPSASKQSKKRSEPKILPVTLPLGTKHDLARCPPSMMACPITSIIIEEVLAVNSDVDWECVSPDEDLYSCGGCATLGTGTDCTSIPGAATVSCSAGACNVHSCTSGYVPSANGRGCTAVFMGQ